MTNNHTCGDCQQKSALTWTTNKAGQFLCCSCAHISLTTKNKNKKKDKEKNDK